MHPDCGPVAAMLAKWRAQGADRLDPLRFRHIEALASRAQRHQGQARRLIEQRLASLLGDYARDVDRWAGEAGATAQPSTTHPAPERGRTALRELLGQVARHRPSAGDAYPELPALAQFRRIWSGLLGERQLRQSLAQVPADAGPLNSRVLVHRAITLMRDVSPDYLQHFLAYADHLAWLERLHDARLLAAEPAAPAAGTRKAAPRKPRKRRD